MKKIVSAMTAFALLGGLAACSDNDTVEEGDTTVMAPDATTAPTDPAAVDVDVPEYPVEGDGDSVSVSEDGVRADINDGDTSVDANLSDDPSLDVEVN